MTDADAAALPRDLPRRAWLVSIAAAVALACVAELVLVAQYGADQGLPAIPAFLTFAAVFIVVPGWVLADRSSRHGQALVDALGGAGDPVFPILESRALHLALGTPRSTDEMVQSIGAALVDDRGLHLWAERAGRAVELTRIDWDRVVGVGPAPVPHGRRVTRAVRLTLVDGSVADLIVAARRGRWFAPADDAAFEEALRAVRSYGTG